MLIGQHQVKIRELAGWGLDQYLYRPVSIDSSKLVDAQELVGKRDTYIPSSAFLPAETQASETTFAPVRLRSDLQTEMAGLDWSLGFIDLRQLLAFQRRLSFDSAVQLPSISQQDDMNALMPLAFGPSRTSVYQLSRSSSGTFFSLQTADPNTHLRTSPDGDLPLIVHGGSPFLEVALYKNRWFLRDGYHRAFNLLVANIFRVPAVVVRARTLEELGATKPRFFSEDVLLSSSPPHLTDFLCDPLVLQYARPRLTKTIRVTVEEIFAPEAI